MCDPARWLTDDLRAALPVGVAVAVVAIDGPQPPLVGSENSSTTNMSPRRLVEFTAGRACARAALHELDMAPCAVPVGHNREPVWPDGTVGSITHSGEFAAAVAAPVSVLGAIGIDIEPAEPLEAELIARICLPTELSRLGDWTDTPRWAKALFAAKEAVYKCLWPRTSLFLEFDEVELVLDPTGCQFRVLGRGALRAHPCEGITGRILWTSGHVVAVASIDGINAGR